MAVAEALCLACFRRGGGGRPRRYGGDDGASGPGGRVGCAARVGGRWAETACLPTALRFIIIIFLNLFFSDFCRNRKEGK